MLFGKMILKLWNSARKKEAKDSELAMRPNLVGMINKI